MNKAKWQRLVAAPLVALMLAASFAPAAMAAGQAAILAQTQGAELSGTIAGGQFAKIWLGLKPINPGTVTVRAEWDRESPVGKGLGFYILDESNLAAVVNGEPLQANNIAAGDTTFYLNSAANVQGAAFRATGPDYTVVVFNDSAADAVFKLTVENGILKDDSGQVAAPAGEATPEAAAADAAAPAVAATDTTTATTTTTTTTAAVTTTTAAPAAVATVAAATPAAVAVGGAVSAEEMKGELPNQFDQHFLSLKPTIKDGDISVVMTYDPQDSTELARRINFWVLDQNGFKRYQEGESAADVAIAAGSKFFLDPDTSNKREASFNAAGFGPYTVIVQNNSRVPATYDLTVTGGILTDDSNQTLTAQQASGVATATTVTGTTTTTAPAVTTTTTTTTTTAAATTSGVVGQPGGTYTVQSGDTLAIIARDIYGDYRLYEQLCAFNSIADCNTIEIGQVVKLPTTEQIGASATAAPAAAATPAATAAATTVATPAASVATTTTATSGVTTTVPVTKTGTTTSSVSSTTTTTQTTTTTPATTKSIVDVATGAGNFTILLDALKQTGIDADLAGAGPFTVFAPTDAAFNALLSGNGLTEAQLLQAKELADILRYHVLSGKVLAADVTNGLKATTLQGKPVSFEVKDGKVYINGAQIVTTDIQAANGVIHAIDAVILPPN